MVNFVSTDDTTEKTDKLVMEVKKEVSSNSDIDIKTTHSKIPQNLRHQQYRFLLVGKGAKNPFEKGWTAENNYRCDDPKLFKHLNTGGNYGVLCGKDNLLVIDFDDKSVQDSITPFLPKTLTVRTGTGKRHYYYKCPTITKKTAIHDAENNTLVDFQSVNTQVIAPGSIHPNGKPYEIIHDEPITEITKESLQIIFRDYKFQPNGISSVTKTTKGLTRKDYETSGDIKLDAMSEFIKDSVDIASVLKHYDYDTSKNPTMCKLGHSSSAGKCFAYDIEKNIWHCFHCGKG